MPQDRRLDDRDVLVDAAELIPKISICHKQTQPLVLVSIPVITENLFDTHDFPLCLAIKSEFDSLFPAFCRIYPRL